MFNMVTVTLCVVVFPTCWVGEALVKCTRLSTGDRYE